jgi:CubicO group peptidase (beta-lactamase class C family)
MFHTLKKALWALVLACCLSINFLCVEPNNIASAHPGRQSQLVNHELTNPIELGAFIDGIMADQMSVNHIPGAIVSVVEDGHLVFEKGYGFSDYENQVPVDPQRTLFRVGSVSKLFVWTAVMQLVEQGKLSLDADINMYLDFKIPATFAQPVTMRNLMSHTAGFEDSGYAVHRLQPEQLISLEQYIKTRLPTRVYPPGKIIAYSNYGASLAGYIVERISGMPFSEYATKFIFSPLEMTHSSFAQPLPADLAPELSNGYNYYQGKYLKAGFEYEVFYPAGGLTSTADDMAKFMLAQLNNGTYGNSRILEEQTAQQMHSPLFTSDPRLPGMAYGFMENNLNGQRLILHGGDTTFFASSLFLIPAENIGIFIATNAPGGMVTRNVLITKFMDRYYPIAPEPIQSPTADFADRMAPYVGTYISARSNYTTPEKIMATMQAGSLSLDKKGNLSISFPGKTFQVVEVQPGLLRDRDDPNTTMVLKTDTSGQAYLIFTGPNFTYIKIPWYESIDFINILIYLSLVLFVYAITIWIIDGIKWLRKRPPASMPEMNTILSRLARWTAGLFGGLIIFVIICMQVGLTTVDPNLGVPEYTFGSPPLFSLLHASMFPLFILGLLMVIFIAVLWIRRLWSPGWRVYYSLLTLSAVSMLWVYSFWRLYIPLP